MERILFLMSGPPASGKTTLRNRMFPKATIICPDELIGYTKENPWTPRAANFAWKESDRKLKEALEGTDALIVFDATFVSVKKRKKYINLAKKHGVVPMIVYCSATKRTILDRNATRKDARKVPGMVIGRMFNSFEAPTKEEGFEVVIRFDSETNEAEELEGKISSGTKEALQIKYGG